MRYKKISIVIGILFFVWVGFIFYMSSQTAVSSGNMSQLVTREILSTGEKLGFVAEGTVASVNLVRKFDSIFRSLAHMSMYFALAGIFSIVLCFRGYTGKRWFISSFIVCFLISIFDEFNQMHYPGRNDSGLIMSGVADLFKDAFGITAALLIFLLIKMFIKAGRRL